MYNVKRKYTIETTLFFFYTNYQPIICFRKINRELLSNYHKKRRIFTKTHPIKLHFNFRYYFKLNFENY